MAIKKKTTPDLFAEEGLDPVQSATGYPPSSRGDSPTAGSVVKKKAGFYLSVNILDRFNHKFHELKLAEVAIDNKSTLLEAALGFALDDMDKGQGSLVLKKIGK